MGDMTAWVLALFASDSIDIALFVTAFVSATLFPGGSEVMLAGALAAQPEPYGEAGDEGRPVGEALGRLGASFCVAPRCGGCDPCGCGVAQD